MKFAIIVSFCLSFSLSGFAQDTIQLTSGEVLNGTISIDLPTPGFERVSIKTDDGKLKFKAHEFISFVYNDEKYVPVKYNGMYRIMRVVSEGYLSLYYFREDESYDFGTKYLYKQDGNGELVPNFSFKKIMTEFLNDCPSVVSGLENNEYKKNKLDEIVSAYNACIDSNTLKSKLNVKEVVNTENPAIRLIDSLMMKLEGENMELTTLLKDIQTKVVQDQPVPGYLKSALKEQTSGMEDIKAEVEKLLNSI